MLALNEIVDLNSIGLHQNLININTLEIPTLSPAICDKESILLLGIDLQYDFLEHGSLAVPGSNADVSRLIQWFYKNMGNITAVKLSKDTHNVFQVFFPSLWIDSKGNHPNPFTPIVLTDLNNRIWIPIVNPIGARDYVENLPKLGKKTLLIWPYHCIQGTDGCAIDSQWMNIVMYHSIARRSRVDIMVKGTDPMSEMYGIFKPEYSPKGLINLKALDMFAKFDKVIITGQAKSHCVLESVKQMLDHYQSDKATIQKMYVLEDTMSVIPGFEDSTAEAFSTFKAQGLNITSTEELSLT